jgi:hypothetical protein
MKHLKFFNEAIKTPCQTPGCVYNTVIESDKVSCEVTLPFDLDLTEAESKELESNIHNAMEIVLSKFFYDKD